MRKISVMRKNVSIRKDLAEELAHMARDDGRSISSLLNEILSASIQVLKAHDSPITEILQEYEDLMMAKEMGLVLTCEQEFLEQEEIKKRMIEKWASWGDWLGFYLQARFRDEGLYLVHRISKVIFWKNAKIEFEWDSDLNPKELTIRIYGSALKPMRGECIVAAYEKIFDHFGFKMAESEVIHGICKIIFKKSGDLT